MIQIIPKKRVKDIELGLFETIYERYGAYINWMSPVPNGSKYLPSDVDSAYHFHSDEKILYKRFAEKLDDFGVIADYLYVMYNSKWCHLWATLNLDYDPLSTENYVSKVEKQGDKSGDDTKSHYGADKTSKENESKITKDVAQSDYTEDMNHTSESEQIFGFNSLDGVASTTGGTSGNTSNKNTQYGNSSDKSFGNENTEHSVTNNSAGAFSERYADSVYEEKKGRIGAKPTDLLQSEIDFRKCIFLDTVFGDVDKLLTIGVY